MEIIANFCKKVVDKFIDVLYKKHHEVKPDEKCSYTLSSVFPSVEIQEQVYDFLGKENEKQVSN